MLSVLVPVMDKPQLLQVVTHLRSFRDYIREIVVVDGTPSPMSHVSHDSIVLYRHIASYSHDFNKSRFLNLALALSSSQIVIACDADVILSETVIDRAQHIRQQTMGAGHVANVIESKTNEQRPGFGIIYAMRESLIRVGGWDSSFIGWGFEDHDILLRLRLSGTPLEAFGTCEHLTHDDVERSRYYWCDDKATMRRKNRTAYEQRVRNGVVVPGSYAEDIAWWKTNYNIQV